MANGNHRTVSDRPEAGWSGWKLAAFSIVFLGSLACSLLVPPPQTPARTISEVATPSAESKAALEPTTEFIFLVTHTLRLDNAGESSISGFSLKVAEVLDVEPYQTVLESASDPLPAGKETDGYGNRYARIEWEDVLAGETRTAEFTYTVRVQPVHAVLGDCRGESLEDFLDPEKYIEADSDAIRRAASEHTRPGDTPCQTIRSLYDYVADSLTYGGYESGDLGALQALTAGQGDCTEFADLLTALSRAAGIPARNLEGVSCCTDQGYREGQTKHDWLEVFLPGAGWVPMDPTYGQNPANRDLYFAAMPANRIIVTRGRNLTALSGYHYYSYSYWYDGEKPSFTVRETWSMLRSDSTG